MLSKEPNKLIQYSSKSNSEHSDSKCMIFFCKSSVNTSNTLMNCGLIHKYSLIMF